ncbi:MAG: PEP-CTERM sorting domain-containing protein [Planctomycetota bacterium]
MSRLRSHISILVVCAFSMVGFALADVSFQGLGLGDVVSSSTASAASDQGAYVVGQAITGPTNADFEAFRWTTAGGYQLIGNQPSGYFPTWGTDVSADGSVVVGTGRIGGVGTTQIAYRWTETTGMVSLGVPAGDGFSTTYAVSTDGTIVAGHSGAGIGGNTDPQGWRWTEAGGMQGIGGAIPDGDSWAYGMSGDGSTLVGAADFAGTQVEAARWTEADGWSSLGDLPGGFLVGGSAVDASADGSVIVGTSPSTAGLFGQAFWWTEADGMQPIPFIAGGSYIATATGVSGDGMTVVGVSDDPASPAGRSAFIWDQDLGTRRLSDALTGEFGLDLTGWDLTEALGISRDGMAIVGYGTNPDGFLEGWVATIPEPSTLGLLLIGSLCAALRRR